MSKVNEIHASGYNSMNRRQFLGSAAVAAFTIVPRHVLGGKKYRAPSDKLNIAGVGIGGMGKSNLLNVESENIVALCDVDDTMAAKVYEKYPGAKQYRDFRQMFEKQKDIDAVIIATPDHTHAVISMMAMKMGIHVYCQKPLTRLVSEARALTLAAREYNVVTQMGIQGHSGEGLRLTSEMIWDGAIGPVREVHVWTDRPVWPQGMPRPQEPMPVPDTLDWDLFLGPAPERPYHSLYHPFSWRGWWDFGTGALGDIACHSFDPIFCALKLKYPISVEANISMYVSPDKFWVKVDNKESFPQACTVSYQFPARGDMPPVKIYWYDGGLKPPRPDELEPERKMGENGVLYVGDKGKIMIGEGGPRLIPESEMKAYGTPPRTLPRVEGTHEMEWVNACKGKGAPGARFDYSGPLTETVVMGNLAIRYPGVKLEWDAENMEVTNFPDANSYIKTDYREGWSL